MAKIFVEYSDENGKDPIFLEVARDDLYAQELELVADDSTNHRIIRAEATLRDHFKGLRDFTDAIFEPYERHAHSPDEIVVEFGIRVGIESGIVVAKGTAEASIQVKATWKRGS